jgi:hypothetical protein
MYSVSTTGIRVVLVIVRQNTEVEVLAFLCLSCPATNISPDASNTRGHLATTDNGLHKHVRLVLGFFLL